MKQAVIKVLDPIECEVHSRLADIFYEELEFEYEIWHNSKSGFGKTSKKQIGNAFSFDKGMYWRFWTGLLPRVMIHLKSKGFAVRLEGDKYWSEDFNPTPPGLKGETFREYQSNFIANAIKKTRGVIVSATGTGKTFIQFGIASCIPNEYILLLADRKGIVNQTYEQAVHYFGASRVTKIDKETSITDPKWLTICTRQKFLNLEVEPDIFTAIMIDEVHHLSSFKCEYQAILSRLLAPWRWGFTASYPKPNETQRVLALEAFIGPKIGEYSIHNAAEDKVLAIPRIRIVREEEDKQIKKLSNWHSVNEAAIINNVAHNEVISQLAIERMSNGKSVLIFVNTVEHMLNLDALFKLSKEQFRIKMIHSSAGKIPDEIKSLQKELEEIDTPLNQSMPKMKERIDCIKRMLPIKREKVRRLMKNAQRSDEYKQWLIDRKINGACATPTWREGINIPSINTIILAGGGKEARKILQEIGRGLRKTDEKEYVEIIDFFNPSHHHLINHFGHRMCEYLDNHWEFIS